VPTSPPSLGTFDTLIAELTFANSTTYVRNVEEGSCKNGSVIVEVTSMLMEDSLSQALQSFFTQTVDIITSPFPSDIFHEKQRKGPPIAMVIIPSVCVLAVLVLVGVTNNRTFTLFAGDRDFAGAVTTAAPSNSQKPPEASKEVSVGHPKVCL
jgi:hypothetical protein